jgi:hypothetical protein
MKHIKKFVKEIKVYDTELTKFRIGNPCDGGYVVLKEIAEQTKDCYSFGIGEDIGFEIDFFNLFPGTSFYLFDPTITSIPKSPKGFNYIFTNIGIGNGYGTCNMETQKESLLKVDIEWNEWDAFFHMPYSQLKKFSQILVEFHIVHAEPKQGLTPYFRDFYNSVYKHVNDEIFIRYMAVLNKLNTFFYCYHIHANNSLPITDMDGHMIPPLLEMSFVRKDLVIKAEPTKESFPIEGLDFPNKVDRSDIYNYFPIK